MVCTSEIAIWVCLVEEIGVMEWLVDISDHMEKISCHKSPFEGYLLFVCVEHFFAPVDGFE